MKPSSFAFSVMFLALAAVASNAHAFKFCGEIENSGAAGTDDSLIFAPTGTNINDGAESIYSKDNDPKINQELAELAGKPDVCVEGTQVEGDVQVTKILGSGK